MWLSVLTTRGSKLSRVISGPDLIFINNSTEPSHRINSFLLLFMERDPNTLSPKMLQGFAEPKASGEGKLSAVRTSPCRDGIPRSLSSRASSEHAVQSLGPLMRSEDATSGRCPQILALLALLSGRSCHENRVGASLVSVEPADGSGTRFRHQRRPLI